MRVIELPYALNRQGGGGKSYAVNFGPNLVHLPPLHRFRILPTSPFFYAPSHADTFLCMPVSDWIEYIGSSYLDSFDGARSSRSRKHSLPPLS